jgi:hypothetical protein
MSTPVAAEEPLEGYEGIPSDLSVIPDLLFKEVLFF